MERTEYVKFYDAQTIAVMKREDDSGESIRIRWNETFDAMIVSLVDCNGHEEDIRSFEVEENPDYMQLHSMMMSIVMWAQETILSPKGPVN